MMPGVFKWWALGLPLGFTSCALHFPKENVEHQRVEVVRRSAVDEPEAATMPVVIFADKLHTGLILDLGWLERHGYVKPAGIGDHRYAAFSWGDETAYVQKRWLHPGQVVHALFLPSKAVMEIIPFDWNIPEVCPHQSLYQSFVPESAGAGLADFLNRSAVKEPDGRPQVAGPSSWGDGLLIDSPHAYYFPRICNIWTVDALNSAGFRMTGITGLLADGVVRQASNPRNGFQKIWDPAWQMEPAGPDGVTHSADFP